jgi:hypothetical protein
MNVFVTNAILRLYSVSKSKIFTSVTAHFLSHITFCRVRGNIVKGRQPVTRPGDLFTSHNSQQRYQRKLNMSDANLEIRITQVSNDQTNLMFVKN